MSCLWSFGHPWSWLVVFEDGDFRGEAEGIMYPSRPLPHLMASHRGHNKGSAPREQAEFRRTQSTHGCSGTRGRKKASEKLTKAHSGSTELETSEDQAVAVYFEPQAFGDFRVLEVLAREKPGCQQNRVIQIGGEYTNV